MKRRDLLAGSLATGLARPAFAQSANRVLRFVPYADLSVLDPFWTTADIVRDHGYMIYDTLYGVDADFTPQPQLAEGHVFEQDGKICTITLRAGVTFHDGEPIRARDCVASLQRWMAVSPMGQTIAALLDELTALDDRRLRFRLKRPFPPLIAVLGQPIAPVPFILPERVAKTDPTKQISDYTGSGPFRFRQNEYQLGNIVVYERFDGYKPTPAAGNGLTSGPKTVHFDRVEWRRIPDPSTAAAALQQNEIDWYSDPNPDLLDMLSRLRNVAISRMELLPSVCMMRPNFLHPPFDNKRIRQALLPAINQADFVNAAVGTDPNRFKTGTGFFPPGSPMASEAGLEPLLGPRDLEKSRRLIKEAGYAGEKTRLLGTTDAGATASMAQVAADLFPRLGFNFEAALVEGASVAQRRRSMEPVDKGGWSVSCWSFPGLWFQNPATHILLRGNGRDAWFGWPTIPKLEELRDAWMETTDLAAQQRIAREMQIVGMDELPCIPLGATYRVTALNRTLRDRVVGFPIFWGVRREV
ncbi:MAG TPA: ABC transporter substrate-binding protein [Candidatus Limnocylindria bacterium]|nr:ABC transporter substrate-binding protein [Candidatus Limnocylindria bacterium]